MTVEPTGRVAATLLSSMAEVASSSEVQHGAGVVMMTALSSGKCTSTREPAHSMAAASRITSRAPDFNITNPALAAPPTGPDIPPHDPLQNFPMSPASHACRARGLHTHEPG